MNHPCSDLTPDDSDELLGLSPQCIQDAASAKIIAYQSQIEQLRSHLVKLSLIHNAAALIHVRLPVEIPIHIFRCAFPLQKSDIQFAQVCRTWRSIILEIPEFWLDLLQNTEAPQDASLLHTFISRTVTNSYSLRLSGSGLTSITAIPQYISRLSTLTVVFIRNCDCSLKLGPLHLDLLLSGILLDLTTFLGFGLSSFGDFLSPVLAVPTLKKLSVTARLYSRGSLAGFLARCSGNLEDLEFVSCYVEGVVIPQAPVFMPRLRQYSVRNTSGRQPFGARMFLHLVACPPTTYLYISVKDFQAALNLALPPNLRLPLMATIDMAVVSFIVGSPSNIIKVTGFCKSRSRLRVELQGAQWGPRTPRHASYLIPDLVGLWGAHRALTMLALNLLHDVTVLESDWRLLLSAFPTLYVLAVRIDSGRPLLRILHKELLCPPLETFLLTCNNGSGMHELFVRAIEFRASNGARLKQLEFCRPRDDIPGQGVPWSAARIQRLAFAVETLHMKVFGEDTHGPVTDCLSQSSWRPGT